MNWTTTDRGPRAYAGWRMRLAVLLGILALGMSAGASSAGAAFGIDEWDGATIAGFDGEVFAQAGGHPFEIVTNIQTNSHFAFDERFGDAFLPDEDLKDVFVEVPRGLMANPTVLPQCSGSQLQQLVPPHQGEGNGIVRGVPNCPVPAQIGVIYVNDQGLSIPLPLYNMSPPSGIPARFGFNILGVSIVLDGAARGNGLDFHLAVDSTNISQALPVVGAKVVFWGVPGDPRHDSDRCAWGFVTHASDGATEPGLCTGEVGQRDGPAAFPEAPKPFLTLPTSCTGPNAGLEYQVAIDSWQNPGIFFKGSFLTHEPAPDESIQRGTETCAAVPSGPSMSVAPTVRAAESPSGLDVELTVPTDGLLNPSGVSQSHLKKVEVTLPDGVSVNPSAGEGLGVCTPAQYAAETATSGPGAGCSSASKVGTVRVDTPLLPDPLGGALYIAQQDNPATAAPGSENPFDSLLALYIVAKDADAGVMIKAAGEVTPDPNTGQLTTTFEDLPQAVFRKFTLSFREGQRSPLSTPAACGRYTTMARFTPYSAPDRIIARSSSFDITQGVGGGPCKSSHPGDRPFKPGLQAGTLNNNAGSYSPLNVRMTRDDGEQEITSFSADLPKGLLGKLAGVPSCSDQDIAKAAGKTGLQEAADPSCPAASQVGRTLVGAGVGSVLAYAPGKVFLAGPYKGSPLSIASITSATVGPFDLGTVIVRSALRVDPTTAQVSVDSAGSDPIPHILRGIPLHIRDIRVYMDRPNFVLNPTSCDPFAVKTKLTGSGADFVNSADDVAATVQEPFQAANCANLPFKPKLSFQLKGGTNRGDHPAFIATLKARPGDANIARTAVTLPHSEFLEQSHIRTVCTRVQFAADNCPPASVYGYAKATTPLLDEPLQGPVYLRSSSNPLPDLVADLDGRFNVVLVGRIDSINQSIRNTFDVVPDAPVTKFTLSMQGGKKGLLVNSRNLCKSVNQAEVKMVGQNGKTSLSRPVLANSCKKKVRKGTRKSKGKRG